MLLDKIFSFSQVTLLNLSLFLLITTSISICLVFILAKAYHELIEQLSLTDSINKKIDLIDIKLQYLIDSFNSFYEKNGEHSLDINKYLESFKENHEEK